jgi:hypothetical protein
LQRIFRTKIPRFPTDEKTKSFVLLEGVDKQKEDHPTAETIVTENRLAFPNTAI